MFFRHALGQKPDSWNKVIKGTKVSESSVNLSLAEMLEGKSATYRNYIQYSHQNAARRKAELSYVGFL